MIKNEDHIIEFIKSNIKTTSKDVLKSIGDDCAVIRVDRLRSLVVTTDTSLLGPHFTKDYSPYEIGYKCLATNLSDIAAMGCKPLYALMAITLPNLKSSWIKFFYKGIKELTDEFNMAIIGGDINKGPLSISIQIIGINKHKILYRGGAKINDEIYVSGELGSARAALMTKTNKKYINEYRILKKSLHMPKPRIDLGIDLSKFATSCIDISDGIAKDIKNIIKESKCGANIHIDHIPYNKKLNKVIQKNKLYECIIGGGEDYELCFTANINDKNKIEKLSKKHNIIITKIGTITKQNINYYQYGKKIKLSLKGFDHFS
tara:strand:- start:2282 stop:3235 length:954 start_codon:yes stop_codon:yes gene_type:complete